MQGLSFQSQLEGLVLAVLGRGPLHGYAIAAQLRERSEGVLDVAEGSLYPVLHKLEKEGLIQSRWEVVNGRRRRVYATSPAAVRAVRERLDRWRRLSGAIDSVFVSAREAAGE
ncbi:MAG TPA: helix-turn-helix transcriptional regulator [Solirubrobacteraceae bacterium]|nr:helix-turn-helix transcriptional regulator [Solirubrobacteraceae bacterium]